MDRRIDPLIGPARRALSTSVCGANRKRIRTRNTIRNTHKEPSELPVNIFRLLVSASLLALLVLISGCGARPATPSTSSQSAAANNVPPVRSDDEITLLDASIKGDTATVKTLLHKGVTPNTK